MRPAFDMPRDQITKAIKINPPFCKGRGKRNAGSAEQSFNHLVSPLQFFYSLTFRAGAGKLFAVLAFLAALTAAVPAQADKDWRQNTASFKAAHDPVGQKVLMWLYATAPDIPERAADLIAFLHEIPDWPERRAILDKIEKNISPAPPPQTVIALFSLYPPRSPAGITAYLQALAATGQRDKMHTALAAFWHSARLTDNETAALAGTWASVFRPADHEARLDYLLWHSRLREAQTMLAFVPANLRALGQARIALDRLSSRADHDLRLVPAKLQNNEGLLFDRLRYRRRKNLDTAAIDMLTRMPQKTTHASWWWKERQILARREMGKGHYHTAYNILNENGVTDNDDTAQAEWLLGWISLRYLHKPAVAYTHFGALYNAVHSAISLSRAAYWESRTAKTLGDKKLAAQWAHIGAQYPSTYYGQLCYEDLGGVPSATDLSEDGIDPAAWQTFRQNELVRAANLLARLGYPKLADPFLARLAASSQTVQDYMMTARLANSLGRRRYAVDANRRAQRKLGVFFFNAGYPTLSALPLQTPERALVNAVIYRESMFDPTASSPAGAGGLMQLMPATAKRISQQIGIYYTRGKLVNDPSYNILIGSTFLRRLLDRYDGSYPLALAAYNAGPGNVRDWIADFGDPRKSDVDVIDWIESIPNFETRNYVERVMEAYYIYRLHFSQKPLTVLSLTHN